MPLRRSIPTHGVNDGSYVWNSLTHTDTTKKSVTKQCIFIFFLYLCIYQTIVGPHEYHYHQGQDFQDFYP